MLLRRCFILKTNCRRFFLQEQHSSKSSEHSSQVIIFSNHICQSFNIFYNMGAIRNFMFILRAQASVFSNLSLDTFQSISKCFIIELLFIVENTWWFCKFNLELIASSRNTFNKLISIHEIDKSINLFEVLFGEWGHVRRNYLITGLKERKV